MILDGRFDVPQPQWGLPRSERFEEAAVGTELPNEPDQGGIANNK